MNHYVKPPERGAGKNFREELNGPPDRKMTQQRSSFWASPAWSAAWGRGEGASVPGGRPSTSAQTFPFVAKPQRRSQSDPASFPVACPGVFPSGEQPGLLPRIERSRAGPVWVCILFCFFKDLEGLKSSFYPKNAWATRLFGAACRPGSRGRCPKLDDQANLDCCPSPKPGRSPRGRLRTSSGFPLSFPLSFFKHLRFL